jgi:hypothetical protein
MDNKLKVLLKEKMLLIFLILKIIFLKQTIKMKKLIIALKIRYIL